jgi:hypothetical protein
MKNISPFHSPLHFLPACFSAVETSPVLSRDSYNEFHDKMLMVQWITINDDFDNIKTWVWNLCIVQITYGEIQSITKHE